MRAADFWNPQHHRSGAAFAELHYGENRKTYLPVQASKLGSLNNESMFDNAGGLQPCF